MRLYSTNALLLACRTSSHYVDSLLDDPLVKGILRKKDSEGSSPLSILLREESSPEVVEKMLGLMGDKEDKQFIRCRSTVLLYRPYATQIRSMQEANLIVYILVLTGSKGFTKSTLRCTMSTQFIF